MRVPLYTRTIGVGALGEFDARGSPRFFVCLLFLLPVFLLPPQRIPRNDRSSSPKGADYFGADYDVRKDVDLEACKAACSGDQQVPGLHLQQLARAGAF